MADVEPDAVCRCGHVYDEHDAFGPGGACTAVEWSGLCPCTGFDLDEEVGPCGSWR